MFVSVRDEWSAFSAPYLQHVQCCSENAHRVRISPFSIVVLVVKIQSLKSFADDGHTYTPVRLPFIHSKAMLNFSSGIVTNTFHS
jgi:hypothetical protein